MHHRGGRCLVVVVLGMVLGACGAKVAETESTVVDQAAARPNFLVIVVDDVGFNEIGSFGSEIETPNLDALAYAGIRLTNFQAASMCSPTRSMLLTGADSHKVGFGNMLEELAPSQQGKPGHEGFLNDRALTVATLLRDSGYRTMMSGKWHLGKSKESSAYARGFQQTFALNSGGASHFSDMQPAYAPSPDDVAPYRENGVVLDTMPDNFEYSSQFYVDRLISQLESSSGDNKPFFAYLSFTAPHVPLQAPDEAIEKYRGRYDEGYDAVFARRLARGKELGVIPPAAEASAAPPKHIPWQQLDGERRKVSVRAMEIYAAMVDEVDRHTGRLIEYLRNNDEFDNTVIIFLADNGAEGHDLDELWPAEHFPKIRQTIDDSWDFSYDAMGKPGSYVLYDASWAWAGSPAFNLYKGFPTEGGKRVAAFVHYPEQFQSKAIVDELMSVKDIAPTLLDLAGIDQPGSNYGGRAVEPMTGVSQRAVLEGGSTLSRDRVLGDELMGKRMLRRGDWKIVHMPAPYGNNEWQLFDLAADLAEKNDLWTKEPEIAAELLDLWQHYEAENGVIFPDWVSGY